MKLRIRYHQTTKVVEISEDRKELCTVSDVLADASSLFSTVFDGDYILSLNKKDPVGGNDEKLTECGIVSGDILYIVTDGDKSSPAKRQNVDTEIGNSGGNVCQGKTGESGSDKHVSVSLKDSPKTKSSFTEQNEVVKETDKSSVVNSGHVYKVDENQPQIDGHSEYMDKEMDETVNQDIVNKCLSEPILCREAVEGSVPALLKEVMSSMKPENETEAFCVVLHVLMLEAGFITKGSSTDGCCNIPENWRFAGHYKFVYTYPGCTDTECLLTVIPTGRTLTLHGKVSGNEAETRCYCLKVSEYVLGDISDCEKCFHQLSKLSRTFKDSVAIPLVQDIRTVGGLEDVYGILALTQETKLRILSYLDVKSLLKLSQVCQELHDISQDPYLWRRLYLKDFGNRRDNSLSQNWKQLYKQEYKLRKERRKMMSRFTVVTPPNWGPQIPSSGPSNWIPPGPGIIGGDYDLYPNFPGSLPGAPGRLGPRPPTLPRPRYDLIGPTPDLDPDPSLLPQRPLSGRNSGARNPFSGFGPRFF